jgi:hypothetical protein
MGALDQRSKRHTPVTELVVTGLADQGLEAKAVTADDADQFGFDLAGAEQAATHGQS